MGSFNTTCAISRAPITESQKVRVFFLVMDTHSYHYNKREKGLFSMPQMGSHCYPWDNYKVIGYPLLATYEDCNNYEFIDKDLERLTLEAINEIYIPNEVQEGKTIEDYNKYHDYMGIEKIENMKQLQDIEHSGSLRVKSYHGTSIIAKMAIIEDVFQELIKSCSYNMDRVNYKKFSTFEEYKQELWNKVKDPEELMKESDPTFDALKKIIKEKSKDKKEYEEKISRMMEFKIENVLRKMFEEQAVYNDVISYHLSQESMEVKERIIEAWVTFKWITNFMYAYNMEYAPAITSGQCYDFQDHARMLDKMSEIISNLRRPYDDETLKIKREKNQRLSISLKELEEKINDWYSPQDQTYQDYLKIKKLIENENIESVDLEGSCEVSQFLINNDLLEVSTGIIHLEK